MRIHIAKLTVPLCSRISSDDLLTNFVDIVLHVNQDIFKSPVAVNVHVRHIVQ